MTKPLEKRKKYLISFFRTKIVRPTNPMWDTIGNYEVVFILVRMESFLILKKPSIVQKKWYLIWRTRLFIRTNIHTTVSPTTIIISLHFFLLERNISKPFHAYWAWHRHQVHICNNLLKYVWCSDWLDVDAKFEYDPHFSHAETNVLILRDQPLSFLEKHLSYSMTT